MFIDLLLVGFGNPGANDASPLIPWREYDEKQPDLKGKPDRDIPAFLFRMPFIEQLNASRILKYASRLFEGDVVVRDILSGFLVVPLEEGVIHIDSVWICPYDVYWYH